MTSVNSGEPLQLINIRRLRQTLTIQYFQCRLDNYHSIFFKFSIKLLWNKSGVNVIAGLRQPQGLMRRAKTAKNFPSFINIIFYNHKSVRKTKFIMM